MPSTGFPKRLGGEGWGNGWSCCFRVDNRQMHTKYQDVSGAEQSIIINRGGGRAHFLLDFVARALTTHPCLRWSTMVNRGREGQNKRLIRAAVLRANFRISQSLRLIFQKILETNNTVRLVLPRKEITGIYSTRRRQAGKRRGRVQPSIGKRRTRNMHTHSHWMNA